MPARTRIAGDGLLYAADGGGVLAERQGGATWRALDAGAPLIP
jgi:hypothetical protein